MARTTLQTFATGDLVTASYLNNIKGNDEDHEDRILAIGTPRGYIAGFEISNNSGDSQHDIDIAVGDCVDDTNSKYLRLTSAMTKQADVTWAKGTNAGGMESGTSLSVDTFYYFWAIEEDSSGDIDILISASQTSPVMPSGWTSKRRIRGAVLTDGSSNILGFRQIGNDFRYNSMLYDVNATSTTSRTLSVVSVPPNFIGYYTIRFSYSANGAAIFQEVSDTDQVPSTSYLDVRTTSTSTNNSAEYRLRTDSSSQIAHRADTESGAIYIFTKGFIDNGI